MHYHLPLPNWGYLLHQKECVNCTHKYPYVPLDYYYMFLSLLKIIVFYGHQKYCGIFLQYDPSLTVTIVLSRRPQQIHLTFQLCCRFSGDMNFSMRQEHAQYIIHHFVLTITLQPQPQESLPAMNTRLEMYYYYV